MPSPVSPLKYLRDRVLQWKKSDLAEAALEEQDVVFPVRVLRKYMLAPPNDSQSTAEIHTSWKVWLPAYIGRQLPEGPDWSGEEGRGWRKKRFI
jgi:hypothetical protein